MTEPRNVFKDGPSAEAIAEVRKRREAPPQKPAEEPKGGGMEPPKTKGDDL
jgi:hypothetical protein